MAAPRSHIHTTDGTTSGTSVSWPERLTELARLACTSTDTGHERDDVVRSLHYHLDAIEGILCDPRPEITQELERCRPKGGRLGRRSDIEPSGLADPGKPKGFKLSERRGLWDAVTEDHWDGVDEDGMEKEKILSQLRTLMKEVTMMKVQLRERRKESNKICDLYEERCRGLERTIAELEFEVVELKADLVEDAVELEGIQGTVHGLQAWADNIYAEQVINRRKRSIAQQKAQRRLFNQGNKVEESTESEADMVLEGLSAWMRGWKDVEEGFQVRARARRTRREQRQALIVREEITSTTVDRTDAGLWSRAFPAQAV